MERDYFIPLTHEDRIRVRFALDAGMVTDFLVQYEVQIGEQWHAVIRYDLAHGFLHRDRLDPQSQLASKEPVPYGTLANAMTEAIREIKANWPEYRGWYEERMT